MKRRQILGTVLAVFLAVIVSAATATPALAQPQMVFVGSFGGAYTVPKHPGMIVEFLDFTRSPVGRADVLMLSIMVDGEVPVAVVTDNAELADGMDEMFAGMVLIVVVEDEELEVWMKGRTMFAYLTEEVSGTHPVSGEEICIHPIKAEIKGCSGKPMKGEESETMPDGSTMTMTYIGYEAVVYFAYGDVECPPVVGMVGSQFQMKITPP